MNDYSNNFSEQEIRTGQTIYKKFRTLYRETEALEKKAARELGENHPITDELGTASVNMMNGDISIEKCLQSNVPGCNQLEFETLKQLFQVLESIRWSGARGRAEIKTALSSAAKLTAKAHGIERNTVADIWVRRLGLEKKTEGFISLVKDWLAGDPSGLKRALKRHAYSSRHGLIDSFFEKKGTLH
jgi:hypothetical protein